MAYQILHGATAQPQTVTQTSVFDTLTGVKQPLVQMFWSMQQGFKADGTTPQYTNFPVAIADALWKRGQLYMHAWSTNDWVNKVGWTTADIVAGKYDAYFHAQAKMIAAWKHPFFVRLNHEFNGNWPGNAIYRSGPDHVALWHYIVQLFKADGATNITWVWCPNEVSPIASNTTSAANLSTYLPPIEDIDWIAFDSYNWGNAKGTADWRSFSKIMDLSVTTLLALAPGKPMMLSEFGCHTGGGPTGASADRVAWLNDALTILPTKYPQIAAINYYHLQDGNAAWPLLAADGSADAWTQGLARGPYAHPGFTMPPDLQSIVPLQAVSAWGDPVGPLVVQLGQSQAQVSDLNVRLDTATAQATASQADSVTAHAALDVLSTSLAQAQSDLAAAQQQTAAATAQLAPFQAAAGQITAGLDALRSLTVQS